VIRVLMLTICVPVGAIFLPIGSTPPLQALAPIGWPTLLAVGALCGGTGFVFARLGVPAGYALGAMAAATTAKLAGFFDGAMPTAILVVAYVLIGAVVGSRFAGITRAELKHAAVGGLIATLMTVGIVTAVAFATAGLVDMPVGQIWLGLAPGALEAMGPLGIALGFDTAFIAAHHVFRLLLLTVAIPVVAMLARERPAA
jgi:uncharacterized protein